MAFDDRRYGAGAGGPGGYNDDSGNRLVQKLINFINWSFSIGNYIGIDVRVHITFILLFVGRVFYDIGRRGIGEIGWSVRWSAVIFMSVLLHEFGHCLACRSVRGHADTILMWPLGGLAMCAPPRRPWAEFVTVIWGPLVNVILAAVSLVILGLGTGNWFDVSFNPLYLFRSIPGEGFLGFVEEVFLANYMLLVFNLALIFYPFDGGRLVQIALWVKMGYARSMMLATAVGMGGAIFVAGMGLALMRLMLMLIGLFGFHACYQMRQFLKQHPDQLHDDHSDSWRDGKMSFGEYHIDDDEEDKEGFLERRRRLKEERRRDKERREKEELEEEVDRILEKVGKDGMDSLTSREKRILQRATEQKRKGD